MRLAVIALGLGIGVGALAGSRIRPPSASRGPMVRCAPVVPRDCRWVDDAFTRCEASLEAVAPADPVGPHPRLALPPPPDDWERRVRDAFAACGIPGELADVSCEQAPCAASFRREEAVTDQELQELLARCPALDLQGPADVLVQTWAVTCPDRTESDMDIVTFVADVRTVGEEVLPPVVDDADVAEAYGHGMLGRTTARLAARWDCGG